MFTLQLRNADDTLANTDSSTVVTASLVGSLGGAQLGGNVQATAALGLVSFTSLTMPVAVALTDSLRLRVEAAGFGSLELARSFGSVLENVPLSDELGFELGSMPSDATESVLL